MKRIFCILLIPMMVNAQDIAGSYQLSGLYIMSQQISRYNQSLNVSDIYGLGLTLPLAEISAGEIFSWHEQGPYGQMLMNALNVIINLSLNSDGSGYIDEGSYYPTEVLDIENCIYDIAIFPVTDQFYYQSDLNAGYEIPSSSILGPLYYQSPFMGETAGLFGISDAEYIFPDIPPTPVHPTLCDGMGNCFDLDLSFSGGEFVSGGDPLPGMTGGYVLKGDLPSFLVDQGNENSNLYIEYLAIDGSLSNSGLGDVVGEDEDGDGTDFDRIGSLAYLNGTYLDISCGFNYPIFGDVTDLIENMGLGSCIDRVDFVNEGYIVASEFSSWGNFLTYNAAWYLLTLDPQYLIDDSDHDFDLTNLDAGGKLVMMYNTACIPMVYNQHAMLEFIEVGGCSYELGDLNDDGMLNILDIVSLASYILGGSLPECGIEAADMNDDEIINILDIIALVNCILAVNCDDN